VAAALASLGCGARDVALPPSDVSDRLQLVGRIELEDGSIATAALSADAHVLVLARPNILATYDSTGARQASIGRSGAGPGEFRQLWWADFGGRDSLWTYDFAQRRLSLFATDGRVLDSWRVASAASPNAVGVLASGGILFVDPFMPMPSRSANLSTDTVALAMLRPPSGELTILGRFPWSVRYQKAGSVALITQPLAAKAHFAVSDSTVFVAFGDQPVVRELDASGRVVRTIQLDLPARGVSDGERAWARSLSGRTSTMDEVPALYADVPIPTTVPVVAGLIVDGPLLWTETFRVTDSLPSTWYAHSLSGSRVDSLSLPAGSTLLALRAPFALLKLSTADGEESVGIYRLRQ
jgi:hypothetical protein